MGTRDLLFYCLTVDSILVVATAYNLDSGIHGELQRFARVIASLGHLS